MYDKSIDPIYKYASIDGPIPHHKLGRTDIVGISKLRMWTKHLRISSPSINSISGNLIQKKPLGRAIILLKGNQQFYRGLLRRHSHKKA